MDSKALDRVLSCPTLPSLPGVAIRMLELLRQPDCTADKIAHLIQNDPALATKVLKTVNSSYYGLSTPCPTITRSVALLGVNTVKSLTLGLSLVDMSKTAGQGFDLVAYWKRAVYAAAASRLIAIRTRACDPDEVFIAALLQDVGMLACFAAIGQTYGAAVSEVSDHELLPAEEFRLFGFDHAEAGARMAEKWRLPDHIVACTRMHHRADNAAGPHMQFVRIVATSSDAAAALSASEPQPKLVAFRKRMRAWFDIDGQSADDLLRQTGSTGSDLAKLLELDTGVKPDIASILAEAGEQLIVHQVEMERAQTELARQSITDALTGAANRKHFDHEMTREFAEAASSKRPLSVLFIDADKFKSVNDTHGHQAGDAVLIETSRRVRSTVGTKGQVCRYGGEEFAVILPAHDSAAARDLAEAIRLALEATPIDISTLGLAVPSIKQTISIGVACHAPIGSTFNTWEQLVHAADEAVYAAKKAGRNRVWVSRDAAPVIAEAPAAVPPPAAPQTPTIPGSAQPADRRPTILIVEDDALAAKMLEVLLTKHAQCRVVTVRSSEDALRLLTDRRETPLRPDFILSDFDLPALSGLDLIRACRSLPSLKALPIAVMSACATAEEQRASLAAGAIAYFDKIEFCTNLGATFRRLSELMRPAARAA